MFERTEGAMQNIAGKIQDAVGGATGNVGTQIEGKARQVAGRTQQGYGEVLAQLRSAARTSPVATLAAVAAVSFIAGSLWSRR
ncbi:CsbD family protein [Variovorax sp. GB1R11]|uniref:CsbD family protein n=1 Tax=Variovorax sp. GB1R11 TaxID=3443741 RepID=UPI003F457445